jgi:membrane complex biogenesis BtpA family protein
MTLKRKLGLSAVLAVVVGDMIGSGIFFTPGELAAVATSEWQVYFFWALCGFIVLCGALTLAELSALIPRAGVSYHALTEAYGPFAGFMQAWMMVLVSGPGAIAGIAILFGELANQVTGSGSPGMQLVWASSAIVFFSLVNLRGAEWGGRTQILLTVIKVAGLITLIGGGVFIATPAPESLANTDTLPAGGDPIALLRFVGLGVAIVLFTYDGWIDASNIAGEVKDPNRNFPLALGLGVVLITVIYLLINYAFLRVMPLEEMRANPTLVAGKVAELAFGSVGRNAINTLMWISIFGALGGLIMTLPRLFYAAASEYVVRASGTPFARFFAAIAYTSPKTLVPAGAILLAAAISILALFFFGSFSRIVTFFVVPFQFMNILMVASVFRLRRRLGQANTYHMPVYPLLPLIFILVMSVFLLSALYYNPVDSLIGIGLTLAGVPVYLLLTKHPDKRLSAISELPASRFARVFPGPKPVIGMIHLPPLPEYRASPGIDAIISGALRDLRVLMDQKFDGALIENEYDRPHHVEATPETIDVMTRITKAVIEESKGIVVGCEILLNDPEASLTVAKESGAQFIRADYFVDQMMRPKYGEFRIDPVGLMDHRSAIDANDILVLADIQVKYAKMLADRPLSESARLACDYHADAVIVTGDASGDAPTVKQIRAATQGVAESGRVVPVLIGSGLSKSNAKTLLGVANGAIVGTSLMVSGAVDSLAANQLMSQVLELRSK